MSKLRVGVLRGGPSSEYDVSLKTGASVLSHLHKDRYEPYDIFIDKQGMWHWRGVPVETHHALGKVDVVFNALHGTYGEDGTVQRILELNGIPFTGSGSFGSSIGMNKHLTKVHVAKHGVRTIYGVVIPQEEDIQSIALRLFRTFPQPSVIKPVNAGSSVGVTIARSYHDLIEGLMQAFMYSDKVLVEEYKKGREATVGIIDAFRGEEHYALPPIEILPNPKTGFFDYEGKYHGGSEEICPGRFTREEARELEGAARAVHRALGLRHYSRSDFIVAKDGIYFLEVNTLPGLTEQSLIPKAVDAVGLNYQRFLDHLIARALIRK